ncbi:MAG: cation:proton antiporter [Dysgonamonadaceae bacterium]
MSLITKLSNLSSAIRSGFTSGLSNGRPILQLKPNSKHWITMAHLPGLIYDLALILLVGSLAALLFKAIKQPLVLGYIIAGFLVSQHFNFLPDVSDPENVKTLAELGVIFLLFSLGLEFSFKKLVRVGPTASITAVVEILLIGVAGFVVAKMLGWNDMDSLFLGGMLASSSTTIILRAFDELGLKTKQFARVVFGVLVVEDIIVILLMVLLSTIAVTRHFEGTEILFTVLKLGFFLVLWFLIGIYLLPTFFKKMGKWLDEETTLLLAIGLCLGMVIVATKVGFSAELGAFVMGSLIAETTKAEKIEHITKPIKELFGTIFFVSVGMMINPQAMAQYAWPIIAITLLVIVGKFLFSAIGVLLSGQPLKQAVQVGLSMAQIGEFAFIVATLGLSLGVISDFLFPIAVGVSAITTFTTPYLIKSANPLYNFIERTLPQSWLDKLEAYSSNTAKSTADPQWKVILMAHVKLIILNSIILIAILLCFIYFVKPFMLSYFGDTLLGSTLTVLSAMLASSPFLWAMLAQKPAEGGLEWQNESQKAPLVGVLIARVGLVILMIGVFIDRLVSSQIALWTVVPLVVISLFIFSKKFSVLYQSIEKRFFHNLHERERHEKMQQAPPVSSHPGTAALQKHLEAWDAHIAELETNPLAQYVGKKIRELGWREKYGINIVYIKRADFVIQLPDAERRILPYDKIGIVATDEQIEKFKPEFDMTDTTMCTTADTENIVIRNILLTEGNRLINKSILHSGLRQEASSQIIGVERGDERIVNLDASFMLYEGDEVWVVGDEKKLKEFFNQV